MQGSFEHLKGPATPAQLKFIKSLVNTKAAIDSHSIGAVNFERMMDVLGGKDVTKQEASTLIDALVVLPKAAKAPTVADGESLVLTGKEVKLGDGKAKRPHGFWTQPRTVEVLKAFVEGTMTDLSAATAIGCGPNDIRWHASMLKGGKRGYAEYGQGTTDVALIPAEAVSKAIKWAKFFGLQEAAAFDLRVICSMFYASERIVNFKGTMPAHVRAEFDGVKARAQQYIDTWAERFGKYALAACLGEYRHRHKSSASIGGAITRRVPRAAAQAAAMYLWPDKAKATKAAVHMAEAFKSPSYFRQHSAFGGQPWSRIASTLAGWLKGDLPNVVFADYCWDLSHNGGVFFNKCDLFQNEHAIRGMLNTKRGDRTGRLEWGMALLHEDWKKALEYIDFAEHPAGGE